MCGICGYVNSKILGQEILSGMNDTMKHRGPNDSGVWEQENDDYAIGMAHRRLSILDLSELGHQPMFSQNKEVVIVFNGEIYNYREIRKELQQKGYKFQSNCDTEVIISAYQEWGVECFGKLNGMFAIAIYDVKQKRLVLARDRMGKKPLYYYHNNKIFCFGSELKPILKFPLFIKDINTNAIGDFLCNKCISAPETIFCNTFKLQPGTYMIYQNGTIQLSSYWDAAERKQSVDNEKIWDYEEGKRQLENILLDSVKKRMISDVPLGSFLSGGIDSTLITSVAQGISNKPVKSFTIGFYDKKENEAEFAAEIAKHIGTEHHELYVSEQDILDTIQDLPFYYDEPFSDSSQLPSMLVSRMASDHITVALSGDGGDELFCGYTMYDLTWIAQHSDWMGAVAYKMIGNSRLMEQLPSELRAFINNRDKHRKTQLFIDVVREEVEKILGQPLNNIKYSQEDKIEYKNWQERRMLLDIQTYLPEDILTKMDRASMKHSLEVRCPLLDYRFVEKTFQIPHKYKYNKFDKKYILKDITYKYVPEKLLDRPKKGFSIPLRKWLRTVLASQIAMYADESKLEQQGIFQKKAIKELIEKQKISDKKIYSSILWSFYIFQRWYQLFIEDLWNN